MLPPHGPTYNAAGNLSNLSWTWNFCNVDWWERKREKHSFLLLGLHNVTVNDGWDVRDKNAMKSLEAVDSSCCCHCEKLMQDCFSKNLHITGFMIWSKKVVWCLPTEPVYICLMLPTAQRYSGCGSSCTVMRYVVWFCLQWYMIIIPYFVI